MNTTHWQELAAQLRHPHGSAGTEVGRMMNVSNEGMIQHCMGLATAQTNGAILELGHGNAHHVGYLLSGKNDIEYFGLEISELMHTEAMASNMEWINRRRASFTLYDGGVIPFEDGVFDSVMTINTLYFWKNPLEMLDQMYRVLKPGGQCCITFADKSFMQELPFTGFGFTLYSSSDFKNLANASSFQQVVLHKQTENIPEPGTADTVERVFYTGVLTKA